MEGILRFVSSHTGSQIFKESDNLISYQNKFS